jgi:hypothetical protein
MDATLVMSDLDRFGGITTEQAREWSLQARMGSAYIWGRQDAGDSDRDTGYSYTFGQVYAMAWHITEGYGGPLQSVYHEWHETGRVLVVQPGTRRIVQITADEVNGTTKVTAHLAVYADGYLPYWPGLVRGVNS